jgi:hypothetical protein
VTNPLNREAGATPAPTDLREREIAKRSVDVIWRAFPYFAWRYGVRGKRFGHSDAGFLVTLMRLDEPGARSQIAWLARVLAPRGMPSLLLEVQLEGLGRVWGRWRGPRVNRFTQIAGERRVERLRVLDAATFTACERICWAAADGQTRRRGTGLLIASAVADTALGLGVHDGALLRWFSEAEPQAPVWTSACVEAHELARLRIRRIRNAVST